MEELIQKLKTEIIEALNLDLVPEEINPDDPIFGDGLGLDSIDALELVVLLDKKYGIKIKNKEEGKKIFISIRTMAQYIHDHKK